MSAWVECNNVYKTVFCEKLKNSHIKLSFSLPQHVREDVMISTRHSSPKRFKFELSFKGAEDEDIFIIHYILVKFKWL